MSVPEGRNPPSVNRNHDLAFRLILLLGLVSLSGDMISNGARSITGPYLSVLGASALIIGIVSGFSEFIGHGMRVITGRIADRTHQYWGISILGYGLLLAVPLLALTSQWEVAALLIVVERIGKATRAPARDAILSHAASEVGRGWGFGVHKALDHLGAIIGPVAVSAVLFFSGSYALGFAVLALPLVLVFFTVSYARSLVPVPEKLESVAGSCRYLGRDGHRGLFRPYLLFIFFSFAGFASFPLISFHLKVQGIVPDIEIPLFYAIGMAVSMPIVLLMGRIYDRIGIQALAVIPMLNIFIPFLAFSFYPAAALLGAILWAVVTGIQETVLDATVADISPVKRRGFAYGMFNGVFGVAWLFGGITLGFLYEVSLTLILLFTVIMQLFAIAALVRFYRGVFPRDPYDS
jgi:MFS family permease